MAEWFSFLSGRKKEKPQVELMEVVKKEKYDIWAALAKALLVFMLSFGAVGGFLSAYAIHYNRLLCGASILGLALLLCFIYETGKKWFTNLCVIGIFIVYAYVAVTRFWVLNSGAYAVINEMYEQAQNYLGIVGGGLYNLQITDTYMTVTAIGIFVGVVLDILFVLRLQYKASLLRAVLLTFTAYLVPIYFERTPGLLYLFMLLAGYMAMGILQYGKVKKHISGQVKQALPIGVIIAAVTVLLFGILLPRMRYRIIMPKNPYKEGTERFAVNYAQYGVMALLMNNMASGGINEGRLSQNITVMPDNEPDLLVRFTPYSMEPVYLKAFTGKNYDGSSWSKATAGVHEMGKNAQGRKQLYEADAQAQPRGVMEVYWLDDTIMYKGTMFWPYYTESGQNPQTHKSMIETKRLDDTHWGMRYVYYPDVTGVVVPGYGVEAARDAGGEEGEAEYHPEEEDNNPVDYLEVPVICRDAVKKACREAGLSGTPQQITDQIFRYFSTDFAYTLRPGYYFGGMDYISYFLSKNKKGFCTHFASAGTMLFRQMGIPARYVEGYVMTYTEIVTDGVVLEGEKYADYFDGYAPLGETAVVELKVPDAQAHAWIEIYLPDKGWTVVDVTPAASLDDEETGSFWDAILGGNLQNQIDGREMQDTADYVENALSGGIGVFGVILLAVALFFIGKWGYGKYQESRLPGLRRVQLEYGRLTGPLKERNPEFASLTTPSEELDFIRDHFGLELPEGLKEELYQVFFAPQQERDYEKLRKTLTEMRKKCKV